MPTHPQPTFRLFAALPTTCPLRYSTLPFYTVYLQVYIYIHTHITPQDIVTQVCVLHTHCKSGDSNVFPFLLNLKALFCAVTFLTTTCALSTLYAPPSLRCMADGTHHNGSTICFCIPLPHFTFPLHLLAAAGADAGTDRTYTSWVRL